MSHGDIPELERRGAHNELAVLLHAFTRDPASLRHVRDAVGDAYPDADLMSPRLPFSRFSMARPEEIVASLLKKVDHAVEQRRAAGGAYTKILLIGHSLGALYARKLYVAACGENAAAPFEPQLKEAVGESLEEPREWASQVERIVLLAGMNRGWSVCHRLSIARAIGPTVGSAHGAVLRVLVGRPPVILTVRRGATFITQLRIQWLIMRRSHRGKRQGKAGKTVGNAPTIQLLGTIDDLVSPEDNIDLVAGKDFVYLDVPRSGHGSVVLMSDGDEEGKARRQVFERAISADVEELKLEQIIPADSEITERRDVDDVVFVIHGIRDEGYWTQKIARRVIAKGREQGKTIAPETSTYGYFPLLSFLRPRMRLAKVEWLMDQYAGALATYPNADFHYVGHSNGTYLLARALQEYPSCRFKRVVFAGSVVRHKYAWPRFIPGQVEAVLNYVTTSDWIVAFGPKALQIFDLQDLGSAGHDGFDQAGKHPDIHQLTGEYIRGGHGAALQESVWDAIASFVVDGKLIKPPPETLTTRQAWWVRYPAKVAPLIWLAAVIVVALGFWALIGLPLGEWQKTLLSVGYWWAVWIGLTRV